MNKMEEIVKAEAVTKTYLIGKRSLTVLNTVSVGIRPGETVAVIGPSGAGKSTLLHALGGLDQPTTGEVWFKGQSPVSYTHLTLPTILRV